MEIDLQQTAAFLAKLHLFRGLTPEELNFAASLLEEVIIPPDGIIFEQDDESRHFFIIHQGRVKVTYHKKRSQEEEMVGFLDEGDYFGQEVLEDRFRKVTVQAISEVWLLKLDFDNLKLLHKQIPELADRFQMILNTYNLSFKIHLDWVHPEEYIHYISRRASVVLLVRLVPLIGGLLLGLSVLTGLYAATQLSIFMIFLGICGVSLIAIMLWRVIDFFNDYFIITDRRVVFQEKVILLYDSRRESPLDQVQTTEIDSTQMGRILGYGSVRIRTLTGVIVFDSIKDTAEVEAFILEHTKRTQSSLRRAEVKTIEEMIKRKIENIPPKLAAPVEEEKALSGLQRFVLDLFHMRYEYGDTIQYRRHWFVLLTREFFPTLLLLVTISLQGWILGSSATQQLGEGFPVTAAVLGLGLVGFLIFLWWLYIYADWHNDLFLITSEKVVDVYRKPLGTEQKQEAPIKNILNVEYKRVGLLGILFNYGSVYIHVGTTTLEFEDVYNPSEVQRDLFQRIAIHSQLERAASAASEQQRMAEWIAAYHRVTHR